MKARISAACAAALWALVLSTDAIAQVVVNPIPGGTTVDPKAITVTSTSAQVQAVSTSRALIAIDNESASATIACAFDATAAINTAGSFTIPAGFTRIWNSYPVPLGAINCISSAASSPITLEVN